MSQETNKTTALHELAPLYALGALDAREKEQFEKHLANCQACAAELQDLREVATGIASTVATQPPAELRERLIARVARSPRRPGLAYNESGLLIARSHEINWRTLAPGISYKPLYQDTTRSSDTMLVRMEPGAHYPSHRHAQVEELFLLSGDLHVQDQVMHAGDYCRADPDSVHDSSYSEGGCLFLLMASPDNQILA